MSPTYTNFDLYLSVKTEKPTYPDYQTYLRVSTLYLTYPKTHQIRPFIMLCIKFIPRKIPSVPKSNSILPKNQK
jgi:hypothetical protein